MSIEQKVKQDINAFVTDVKSKAKVAYDKGTVVAEQVGGLVKSNTDVVVASGKTLGLGLKDLGEVSVADGRQALETLADDFKEIVSVKSPSDFLRLQGQIAGRNFDSAIALASKNGEALRALAASVFAPLQERVKANIQTVRKAA